MDTIYYLDLLKVEKSITSDYQLAKLLGISRGRLSNYRNKHHDMDELLALKIEKLLNLKPGTVLLDIQANRSKCPEARKVLHEISQKLAGGALAIFLALSLNFAPMSAEAGQFVRTDNNIHYAHNN